MATSTTTASMAHISHANQHLLDVSKLVTEQAIFELGKNRAQQELDEKARKCVFEVSMNAINNTKRPVYLRQTSTNGLPPYRLSNRISWEPKDVMSYYDASTCVINELKRQLDDANTKVEEEVDLRNEISEQYDMACLDTDELSDQLAKLTIKNNARIISLRSLCKARNRTISRLNFWSMFSVYAAVIICCYICAAGHESSWSIGMAGEELFCVIKNVAMCIYVISTWLKAAIVFLVIYYPSYIIFTLAVSAIVRYIGLQTIIDHVKSRSTTHTIT